MCPARPFFLRKHLLSAIPPLSTALIYRCWNLSTLAIVSSLPQIIFHQNYLPFLFSCSKLWLTQDCWSWLGIRQKATRLNQLTKMHEGLDSLWTHLELAAIFKTAYYPKGMSVMWFPTACPSEVRTSGTVGERYFWASEGQLILNTCPWSAHAAFPFSKSLSFNSEPPVSVKLFAHPEWLFWE